MQRALSLTTVAPEEKTGKQCHPAVTFFVRQLPRGKHSLTYKLRAEIPGKFSALPAIAQAMYAPELVGNSDEMKISIIDQE